MSDSVGWRGAWESAVLTSFGMLPPVGLGTQFENHRSCGGGDGAAGGSRWRRWWVTVEQVQHLKEYSHPHRRS